jgi:geranylgeranyl diphosphate synthase type I
MGYVLTGKKTAAVKETIREFALPLGMAFQVRDDILGIFGSEKDIGKPSDSDIREGKLTLLIQDTADSLSGDKREQFINVFTGKEKSADDIEMIRDMVRESGALEKARKKHGELINQSEGMLFRLGLHRRALPVLQGVIDLVREIG